MAIFFLGWNSIAKNLGMNDHNSYLDVCKREGEGGKRRNEKPNDSDADKAGKLLNNDKTRAWPVEDFAGTGQVKLFSNVGCKNNYLYRDN